VVSLWSKREYGVRVDAPSTVAWSLVARPDRWHEWAPHVRGAWHLGDPEVSPGKVGAARLVGVVPVPAKVVSVDRGRSWTWHVGPVRLEHTVEPESDLACRIVFRLDGPVGVVHAYGPVVHGLLLNLARVARLRGGTA
jgi:hypothetical protein